MQLHICDDILHERKQLVIRCGTKCVPFILQLDAEKRVCSVTVTVGMQVLGLKLTFPQLYPYNASPTFQFLKGTTVDNSIKTKLLRVSLTLD